MLCLIAAAQAPARAGAAYLAVVTVQGGGGRLRGLRAGIAAGLDGMAASSPPPALEVMA